MIKGIDISHYQGNIDWAKIPKDCEFAIMKASQGTTLKDVKMNEYKKGARSKGMGVGYYHYANGGDPIKEADFFLASVGDIAEGEILALDFEIKISNPVDWCNKFVKRIIEKAGFTPLFYSYSSLVGGNDWGDIYNCGLWIADPSESPRIGKWKFWAVWQYTIGNIGAVQGVPAKVDLDYFNGDIATFKKYGKPKVETPKRVIGELKDAIEKLTGEDYGNDLGDNEQKDAAEKLLEFRKNKGIEIDNLADQLGKARAESEKKQVILDTIKKALGL